MNRVKIWGLILGLVILEKNLYALGENIKTFRADFVQKIQSEDETSNQKDPKEYEQISYQGSIEAKTPNLAKWTYIEPIKKEIFIVAKKIIVYEPNLYQATITHLKEEADFLSILRQAKPKSDKKYISEVGKTLYLLTVEGDKPTSIEFKDEFNNEILIILSNVVINAPIDDKNFVFTPREGTDIIEQQ